MKFRLRAALIFVFLLMLGVFTGLFADHSVKAVDKMYNIMILVDSTLEQGENSAACDVEGLGKLYSGAGHSVSYLDRKSFADPALFNATSCDIVVIPTGQNFPVEAVPNFKKFVADGGRVITLGGYAFSKLLNLDGEAVGVDTSNPAAVNKDLLLGSNAPLYAQDQLRFDASQMPIFDEEHFFDSAISIRPAQEQAVFEGELKLSGDAMIKGYSAITTTGNYRGRWQPLIYAYDHVGTRVGTVGAIFHLYSHPRSEGAHGMFPTWNHYKGTSIAFFGITSHDLIAQGNDQLRKGFLNLTDVLMADTYIASIENKYDNYRQGEKPEFDVYVENGSAYQQRGTVILDIVAEDTGSIVAKLTKSFVVDSKSRQTVKIEWDNAAFDDDFYQVNARVELTDGMTSDRYQTGFSVWDENVIANGPKYIYENNYIKLQQPDGSYKAIFATGVDDGGNLLINEDQTPLVWKEEFMRRQDTGMYIYECLQQYRSAGDFAHLFTTPQAKEKHYRSVDNIVYLSQKYGQIYMMGIAIGDDVSAGGGMLEDIAKDVHDLAKRYASVPGLIYYLNGDLICRVSNFKNMQDFNQFLTGRYGSSNNLNKAWGTFGLELGAVPLEDGYSYNGTGWTDVKAHDINLFKTTLITRWTSRLRRAIVEAGQGDKIVLCEFYSWPAESVDIPLAIGEMTYSNIGFFQTRQEFTQTLAYADQRFNGKSFGIGETGRRTHPSFSASELIYRSASYDDSRDFFFTGLISTYAMGGNHYQQWCWNDESKYVFPWGMNYTGDKAPRDLYYWFRNTNFVMKQTEPVYEVPEVAIILPDSTRASGSEVWYGGHYGAIYALDVLQGTHVDSILTLNESNLVIDPNIKVIYYPMAYTVSQDVYDTLKGWVENGGTLYISGDFTYDPLYRTRDYGHRLTELAGVKAVNVNYAGLDQKEASGCNYNDGTNRRFGKPNVELELAGAEAIYSNISGTPIITRYQLGSGNVIYSCDPVEYAYHDTFRQETVALYRQVLQIAGKLPTNFTTDGKNMKIFRLALSDGGQFYELLNVEGKASNAALTVGQQKYEFEVAYSATDYIRVSKDGKLLAVLTEGQLKRDDSVILADGAFAHIVSMDGQDITQSKQIVALPQQSGKLVLRSDAKWSNLSVRIGQIEGGKWIDMGKVHVSYADGCISIDVSQQMVNAVIVIGEKSDVTDMTEAGLGFKVADALVTGGAKGCVTAAENGGVNMEFGTKDSAYPSDKLSVAEMIGGFSAVGLALLALFLREKFTKKKK